MEQRVIIKPPTGCVAILCEPSGNMIAAFQAIGDITETVEQAILDHEQAESAEVVKGCEIDTFSVQDSITVDVYYGPNDGHANTYELFWLTLYTDKK